MRNRMKYKYEDYIQQAFQKYKLIPRVEQIQIINDILIQYIDNHKKYIILSAPTGSGKSIIGVMVGQCLSKLDNSYMQGQFNNKISTILMQNKALQDQYIKTFQNFFNFLNIKGANNYPCILIGGVAQNCIMNKNLGLENFILPECQACNYKKSRQMIHKTQFIISNYSYHITMSQTQYGTRQQLLTIFDESHLINDIFCSQNSIKISVGQIQGIISILNKYPIDQGNIDNETIDKMKNIIKQIQNKKITQDNYNQFIQNYKRILIDIISDYDKLLETLYQKKQKQKFVFYNKFKIKFSNIVQRFNSYLRYKYQHIINIEEKQINIQPIFMKQIFNNDLLSSKYVLFMSATNQDEFIITTLSLSPQQSTFIKMKPVFDPNQKKILFIMSGYYNYKNINEKETLDIIINSIKILIKKHNKEKGIIITPSFKLSQYIYKELYKNSNIKVINHESGQALIDSLSYFKSYKKPAILISPSLWQGISLDDDISRYQIIVKAPYLNLGDRRIRYILENYPEMYKIQTIFKFIQGLGRSTRNKDDYAISYCLDGNLYTLFDSSKNVWKDQFLHHKI